MVYFYYFFPFRVKSHWYVKGQSYCLKYIDECVHTYSTLISGTKITDPIIQ